MQRIFLTSLFLLLLGCGRLEIKNPEDIISMDAKAVLFIPNLEPVLSRIPVEGNMGLWLLIGALDEKKSAALVITSLDPFEAYIALPVKKELEEQLTKTLATKDVSDIDQWSGYVFVSLRGSLPSSFGNKEFLPENKNAVLYARVKVPELLEGHDQKLESFKKYKSIRGYGYVPSTGKILTRFLIHDFVDFSKQVESYELICDDEGLTANVKLINGSEQAKNFNSMVDFQLPVLDTGESDIAFSSAVDFSKLDFPLTGLETAFKSYLSSINKGDTIFPMDSVFNKLRDAQRVHTKGIFKIIENNLTGQTVIKADQQEVINESVKKFVSLMSPEFFSNTEMKGKISSFKILRSLSLPARTVNTDMNLLIDPEFISISDKSDVGQEISISEEKGLLYMILEPSLFTSFDTAEKSLFLKVTVEENLIKLKAGLK